MSIGDSNVVDGADVNPPSADAGPDPCVSSGPRCAGLN